MTLWRDRERVPAQPFIEWLKGRLELYEHDYREFDGGSPNQRLAYELGISDRALWRYQRGILEHKDRDGQRVTKTTDTFFRASVEDMLHRAGVLWHEVYPAEEPGQVYDRWCPSCREMVIVGDDALCPWCESATSAKKPRGGWKRPDRTATAHINDDQLRVLHRIHIRDGLSVRALAKQIWERCGFKSDESASRCIYVGWKRLGLPARDRIEQTRLSCTTHGLAPKHGPRPGHKTYLRRQQQEDQPRCIAVRSQYPRKGERCQLRAQFGSEYCFSHDPARTLERQAKLAKMRARQPRADMLPFEPFVVWLHRLRDELGTFAAVAERIGMDRSLCYRYVKGENPTGNRKWEIGVKTARRYAECAGHTLDDIYGRQDEEWANAA